MRLKKIGLTLFILAIGSSVVWANGFHSNFSDAASLAQATGGITRVETATAAQDLPASMPFLSKGTHLQGTLFQTNSSFDFSGDDGDGSTITPALVGAFFNGLYNTQDWAIGVSQNFPFASIIDWGEDWVGRGSISSVNLKVSNTSPVGAYRVNDNFSVGAGINIYNAEVKLERAAFIINSSNEIRTELAGTGDGMGYQVSGYYSADRYSAGLIHHSAFTLKAEDASARFDTSDPLAVPFAALFPDTQFKLDLLLPSITRVGLAYRQKETDPDYMVELTLTRTGWSNFKELRFRFDDNIAGSNVSVTDKNWEDTTGFTISGNYVVSRLDKTTYRVRGGLISDPSPIPSKTLDGITPDTGRQGISGGLGVSWDEFMFDFAVLLQTFVEGKSELEGLEGTYSGSATVFAGSVAYHF